MLNSGKKFRALRDKKINILTLVLSEFFFLKSERNKKPYPPPPPPPPPPFKLNGRSLTILQSRNSCVFLIIQTKVELTLKEYIM